MRVAAAARLMARANVARPLAPMRAYVARPLTSMMATRRAASQWRQARCHATTTTTTTAARRELVKIHAALDNARGATRERFEPSVDEKGVLLLDLGAKGQYSLQVEGERLLLFSAYSGPRYYVYDAENEWWASPDDGHLLIELLVRELMHSVNVYINL